MLKPFVGLNNNHAFLPRDGGLDIVAIGLSAEEDCIDLMPASEVAYIVKPRRLTFEYIEASPADSFFLLELDRLTPSYTYEHNNGHSEELVEVEPLHYVERRHWDENSLGHDESGWEIPLPETARILIRLFHGKILFVAKASLWNRHTATYDGRHSHMTADQIRQVIERSL